MFQAFSIQTAAPGRRASTIMNEWSDMSLSDDEYFFEVNAELYKTISVKRDGDNHHIQCTVYDDLGIIRKVDSYKMASADISKVKRCDCGMEIHTKDGRKLLI